MGKITATGIGSSVGSDDCTAGKAQVLTGYTAVTSDSEDEAVTGTMPNNGEQSATLKCGESKQIPAGYTPGGTVTAADLASQTGGATAEDRYVYPGKTYWRDGVLRTGSMSVPSVLSFSVAAYSTSQILATWKNPANGPFSGVAICAKTGGYPANINDGRVYTGIGNNSAANGISSAVISGLTAGITYYFRIWAYVTCGAGDLYSGYMQDTGAPTAHGRAAYTSSGTFTVPAGVRSVNIHCTGAGSKGGNGSSRDHYAGGGGGGGYAAWKTGVAVKPGDQIVVAVGAGGTTDDYTANGSNAPSSSATLNGTTLVSAQGGSNGKYTICAMSAYTGKPGGNAGGNGATFDGNIKYWDGPSDGGASAATAEFGNGTRYAGGGGGGGGIDYDSGSETDRYWKGGAGGGGGGGAGSGWSITGSYGGSGSTPGGFIGGSAGSAGTGGGGGGKGVRFGSPYGDGGYNGGSGNVIITW